MRGHLLRALASAAIAQVLRDPGRPKRMIPNPRPDSSLEGFARTADLLREVRRER